MSDTWTSDDTEPSLDDWIAQLRVALAAAAGGTDEQHEILAELASALVERHELVPEAAGTADLDEAIGHASRLAAALPDDHPLLPRAWLLLGLAQQDRVMTSGDPADLDAAIESLSQGSARLADDDPQRDGVLDLLSDAYAMRGGGNPSPADLDRMIDCLAELWNRLPDDDPERAMVAARFGLALGSRVLEQVHLGRVPSDLDTAAELLTLAEPGLRDDQESHGGVIAMLGLVLGVRFLFLSGAAPADDRDGAIGWLEQAVARSQVGGDALHLCQQLLGRLLLLRAVPHRPRPGSSAADLDWVAEPLRSPLTDAARADLDRAIGHLSPALDAPSGDEAFQGATLALLGQALLLRGSTGLSAAELDQVVACLAGARQRLPRGAPGHAEVTALLGIVVGDRSRGQDAQPSDAEAATEALEAAVDLLPTEHQLRPTALRELGLVLMARSHRHNSGSDLSRAAGHLTAALELMLEDHPQRLDTLGVLGNVFVGSLTIGAAMSAPAERAISLLTQALVRPPADPARHALFRLSLGLAMSAQWVQQPERGDIEAALEQMTQAAELLPPDHEIRLQALFSRALVLVDRYGLQGEAQDLDAASLHLSELDSLLAASGPRPAGPSHLGRATVRAVLGDVRLRQAMHRREPDDVGVSHTAEAVRDLQAGLDALEAGDPMRARLLSELGTATLANGIFQRDIAGVRAGVAQIVAGARAAPQHHVDQSVLLGRAGHVLVSFGEIHQDPESLDHGINLLMDALSGVPFSYAERSAHLWGLGHALVTRHRARGDPRDLEVGIARLEEARTALDAQPASPTAATVLNELALAYRTRSDHARGDGRRSLDTAKAALQERARSVLLQAGAERGLALARATSEDVVRTALWCLADGKAELAVEALETGRGLVLHAATAAADVPALLRAAGHGGLAAEWEAAGASTTEPPWDSTTWSSEPGNESDQRRIVDFLTGSTPAIPHDLRFRVLAALDDSAATGRLLTPPTVQEIAATLQAAGQDAIVYLLPRLERAPGRALLISAGAEVIELPLYLLHTEPEGRVAAYVAAQREALASGKTDEERAAAAAWWRNALGELCDWAWDAAVSPLLGHPAVRRLDHPPRLTLVPVGLLGAVPWHAARTRDAGGDQLHYACEAAVFSYAASARQLDDAVHRRRHPLNAAPVIVANPTGDLPFATIEARALVERHYPDGVYLGQPRKLAAGTGTPEEVLAWLPTPERPGASVLHLGCHAHTGLSSASAHLELADRQPLAVTRILRQAHGRPADSAGGLIVIAACTSDLTNRDHDEALTLATTFLAAGAVSVVGARWEVGDARTALLMVMFHHYLNGTHPTPVDALHAAQRWMLDPGREIPAGISPLLADWATKADLRDAFAWAAFTHHGQ